MGDIKYFVRYFKEKAYWCGYIVVPKTHPWYGKNHYKIDCCVNLSFGEFVNNLEPKFFIGDEGIVTQDLVKDGFVVGFVAMGYSNGECITRDFILKQTINLAKQAELVCNE